MYGLMINIGEDSLGIVAPFMDETSANQHKHKYHGGVGVVFKLIRPTEGVGDAKGIPVASLPKRATVQDRQKELQGVDSMGIRW